MTAVSDTLSLLGRRYYSPAMLATELEVDRRHVYAAISEVALRAFKVGRHWRINREDALKWLASVSNTEGTVSKDSKEKRAPSVKGSTVRDRDIDSAFRSNQKRQPARA